MRSGWLAIVVTATVLAGCAGPEPVAVERAPAAVPVPRPGGVEDQPDASATTEDDATCDPRASFRPDGTTTGPTLDQIRGRGLLRVGGQQTYFLLSYRDPVTGEMSGFEVDLAREMARAILGDPDKIQFVALARLQERETALQNGIVDIVFASMNMTCPRWRNVAFSTEYLSGGQKVLVNRQSTATGIQDLGGRKVCASNGSTDIARIRNTPSHPILVGAANATDCLLLLQQGQVDAVSTGANILAGLAAQDRNTKIIGDLLSDTAVAAAMNSRAIDLVRFVNGELERLRANGTWNRLYDTWLRPTIGPASLRAPVYRD
jgi:polar amino acid transport system substrate-binding protein